MTKLLSFPEKPPRATKLRFAKSFSNFFQKLSKNVSALCNNVFMTHSQNDPDTTANYLGLMLMMGFPATSLQKFGDEIEIPDGAIEDRLLEIAKLQNNLPEVVDPDTGLNAEVIDLFTKRPI
jgi:hypothetical protein